MVNTVGGRSKRKVVISFDDNARSEYLSGFRKRKLERKERAQKDIEKRLKNQVKQERNKKRKATHEKVNEILEGITLPNKIATEDVSVEKVDFGTHEVLVKTDIDFGETGLFVASSKNDDDDANTETKPSSSDTSKPDSWSTIVSAKKKSKWSKLTQKKKTKPNPHFVKRGEKKGAKPDNLNVKKGKAGKKKR